MAREIDFKTVEKIGVIRENEKSTVELRITEANGSQMYDIRSWFEDKDGNEKCGKGIRLTKEELDTLVKLIKKIK
jgi:hypothetical protein